MLHEHMSISNLREEDLENFHLKYWYFSQTKICKQSLIWKNITFREQIISDIIEKWKFHSFLEGCNWQRIKFGLSDISSLWDPVDASLYLAEITSRLPFLKLKNYFSVAPALLITKTYTLCSQQMKPKACLFYEEQYQTN